MNSDRTVYSCLYRIQIIFVNWRQNVGNSVHCIRINRKLTCTCWNAKISSTTTITEITTWRNQGCKFAAVFTLRRSCLLMIPSSPALEYPFSLSAKHEMVKVKQWFSGNLAAPLSWSQYQINFERIVSILNVSVVGGGKFDQKRMSGWPCR